MTRQEVINYLNSNVRNTRDAMQLLVDYAQCLGKNQQELSKLVQIVTMFPNLFEIGLRNAIDYYKRKYNICSIIYQGVEFNFF